MKNYVILLVLSVALGCAEEDSWYLDDDPVTQRYVFDKFIEGNTGTPSDINNEPVAVVDFTVNRGYRIDDIRVQVDGQTLNGAFTGEIFGVEYPNINLIRITSSDGSVEISFQEIHDNIAALVHIKTPGVDVEYPNGILVKQYWSNGDAF